MGSDSRKQTVHGKEATSQVLFSHEGTDYLVVWRMDTTPNGLERYLVRPRTHGTLGEPLEAERVPPHAPRWAHRRLEEEARLVSRLVHPTLERVLGLYPYEDKHFLLKEHVEGCSPDTASTGWNPWKKRPGSTGGTASHGGGGGRSVQAGRHPRRWRRSPPPCVPSTWRRPARECRCP